MHRGLEGNCKPPQMPYLLVQLLPVWPFAELLYFPFGPSPVVCICLYKPSLVKSSSGSVWFLLVLP